MVRHAVDGDKFVLLGGDNPGDEFVQFLFVFGPDQVLPALNGKDDMEINLRVGIGHAQKMPLLTELGNLFSDDATNMPALRAWGSSLATTAFAFFALFAPLREIIRAIRVNLPAPLFNSKLKIKN